MVTCQFIYDGLIVASAKGYDWMQALDRAYVKVLKLPTDVRGRVKFKFS